MNSATIATTSGGKKRTKPVDGYLFSPLVDFLCLGGSSLIVFLLLIPFGDFGRNDRFVFWAVVIGLSLFINYPHFALSYQIFYRDFKRKIGNQTERILRYRYWFAGIVVPIVLISFLAYALITVQGELIGYTANLMFFLVGWHYVKQGYGMLSVDAVLKRKFYTDIEKKILTWNGYAVWIFTWIKGNQIVAEKDYFGLAYYTFAMPEWLSTIALAALVVFGLMTTILFVRRLMPQGKGIAVNGAVAYFVSLYIWLAVLHINPLLGIFVPALHSLQYLTVVGKFSHNVESENVKNGKTTALSQFIKNPVTARVVRLYLIAMMLGALGFLLVPLFFIGTTNYHPGEFGSILPMVVAWLFINIHHYFLDNVMWRKGNPEVSKHLFASH